MLVMMKWYFLWKKFRKRHRSVQRKIKERSKELGGIIGLMRCGLLRKSRCHRLEKYSDINCVNSRARWKKKKIKEREKTGCV